MLLQTRKTSVLIVESEPRRKKAYPILSACFLLYKYYANARAFTYSRNVYFDSGNNPRRKKTYPILSACFRLYKYCAKALSFTDSRKVCFDRERNPRRKLTYPTLPACFWLYNPASILRKSTSGRHRPVSYPDGPMTARYRFT